METKKVICTCCPMGCHMEVTLENGAVTQVAGNTCKRGAMYAADECTNPKRTLTTTVRTVTGEMLPVKTAQAIPRDKLFEAMRVLSGVCATLPVHIGDVICSDICGTGVDVLAAARRESPAENSEK